MTPQKLGGFLAALRKEQGLTQQQLAERLGVSNKSVSRWETGESAPDLFLLPAIARLYHVTCDELLAGQRAGGEPEAEPPETDKTDPRRALSAAVPFLAAGCAAAAAGFILCITLAFGLQLPVVGVGLCALCCLTGAVLLAVGRGRCMALLPPQHPACPTVAVRFGWAFAFCGGALAVCLPHLLPVAFGAGSEAVILFADWLKFALLSLCGGAALAFLLAGALGKAHWPHRRRRFLAAGLAILLLAPAMGLLQEAYNNFLRGTKYTDFESFKAAIEQPVANAVGDLPEKRTVQIHSPDGVRTEVRYGKGDSWKDPDGRVYRWYHGNLSVADVHFEKTPAGLKITTYTPAEMRAAARSTVAMAGWPAASLVCCVWAFGPYKKRR